jgi:hypothetical protein
VRPLNCLASTRAHPTKAAADAPDPPAAARMAEQAEGPELAAAQPSKS